MVQIYSNRRDTKVIVGTAERVVSEMDTPDAKNLDMSDASSPTRSKLSINNPAAHTLTDTTTYHEWFTLLYLTHRATLIAQASTILYNSSSNNSRLDAVAAEDMMHQAFALAWEKRGELIGYDMPIVWLRRAVYMYTMNYVRKEKRYGNWMSDQILEGMLQVEMEYEGFDLDGYLVKKMKPREKLLYQRWYMEKREYAEIGKLMGISETAARLRVLRLREKMAGWVEGY